MWSKKIKLVCARISQSENKSCFMHSAKLIIHNSCLLRELSAGRLAFGWQVVATPCQRANRPQIQFLRQKVNHLKLVDNKCKQYTGILKSRA